MLTRFTRNFLALKHAQTVLKYAGITGSLVSVGYSVYMLLIRFDFVLAFMYVYLILFAISLIAAELGFFQGNSYQAYVLFMTTHTGRGLFYIFVAGLLLRGWGIPVASYLILIGFMNICLPLRSDTITTSSNSEEPCQNAEELIPCE